MRCTCGRLQGTRRPLVRVSGWGQNADGDAKPCPGSGRRERARSGEILPTSMDHDGTKDGSRPGITREVSGSLNIPVIASGGAGRPEHFLEVFREGKADAALAASVFHFAEIGIPQLKRYIICMKIQFP
ncbi:MAG: HisA/HisF-related TIM barrel protein [Candidatus Marinimicrobia bacterium]|nr:HisA/HisF-related TIM barrel protein [Candidatus Neomarinimicrobiota bacterium]